MASLSRGDRYRILSNVVIPRPIAWVTSIGADGIVNVAPFSFFNVVGSDPGLVVLGIGDRANGEPKDTRRNIAETGEFVVNLVTHAAREAMNDTSAELPPGVSEVDAVGLETTPSAVVRPPRLALSPVHLECRGAAIVEVGRNRLVLGEVVQAHVDDRFVDAAGGRIRYAELDLIGRTGGRDGYATTRDTFLMPRPPSAERPNG